MIFIRIQERRIPDGAPFLPDLTKILPINHDMMLVNLQDAQWLERRDKKSPDYRQYNPIYFDGIRISILYESSSFEVMIK